MLHWGCFSTLLLAKPSQGPLEPLQYWFCFQMHSIQPINYIRPMQIMWDLSTPLRWHLVAKTDSAHQCKNGYIWSQFHGVCSKQGDTRQDFLTVFYFLLIILLWEKWDKYVTECPFSVELTFMCFKEIKQKMFQNLQLLTGYCKIVDGSRLVYSKYLIPWQCLQIQSFCSCFLYWPSGNLKLTGPNLVERTQYCNRRVPLSENFHGGSSPTMPPLFQMH